MYHVNVSINCLILIPTAIERFPRRKKVIQNYYYANMFNSIIILSMISVNLIQAGSIPDACYNYCSNGGSCYQSKAGFGCVCSSQWTGERCDVRQNSTSINERVFIQADSTDERNAQCDRLNPPFCQNNGFCYLDANDKFACYCRDPYIGVHCEIESGKSLASVSIEL